MGAAFNYAWYATNYRMGPKGDVATNKLAADAAITQMKKLGAGLLPSAVVEDFRGLFVQSGFYAAHTRLGYAHCCRTRRALLDEAKKNEINLNTNAAGLSNSGLFDEGLVMNLKGMAIRGAWWAANIRDGCCPDDAKTDKTYFDNYHRMITGEVKLLSISFDSQASKVVSERPASVGHQVLDNSLSNHEQSMTFSYSYTQGHTYSWSNTVGFKVGISEEIAAGFLFASEKTTVSYEASFEHSWSGGGSSGETKAYSFPLVVPPRKIYEADATVHQSVMDVPYTMKISIGTHTWTSSGIWHGVAVSSSVYKVTDITPGSTIQDLLEVNVSTPVVLLV